MSDLHCLADVIEDALFPELDLALRRGRHVDRGEGALYELALDGETHLAAFYARFGFELVHENEGYFYLVPRSEQLPKKALGAGEMLVGQELCLCSLDPSILKSGGLVDRAEIIARLQQTVGLQRLVVALNPRRRGAKDERTAEELVRMEVGKALRTLARLGFVEFDGESKHVRVRPAIARFAELARAAGDPAAARARLLSEMKIAPTVGEEET